MHHAISVDLRVAYRFVLWSTIAVIGLGLFREFYVQTYGLETPLKDLRHISLEEKHSLQAWQQSSLALLGACIAAMLAAGEGPQLRRYWVTLAWVMAYISIDQQVTIHQSTIVFLKKLHAFDGFLYFPWVIWAVPLCVSIGIWFVPFLLKIPRRFAVAFVLSGAIFVGASVGLELLGGKFVTLYGRESWQYTLEFILEESLESVGLALFVVAALEYWHATRNGATLYTAGALPVLSRGYIRILPETLAGNPISALEINGSVPSIERRGR